MSAFQALPAAAPRDPPLPRGASGRARWNYGDCPVPLLDAPRRAAAFRSRKRNGLKSVRAHPARCKGRWHLWI